MTKKKANFLKLSVEEMGTKLSVLAKQKEVIKVWEKGEDAFVYRVTDYTVMKLPDSSNYFLTLFSEGKESDDALIGKRVLINFSIKDSDYFSDGVVAADDVNKTLHIQLSRTFYRTEKRGNERLLTFPHHQVYAYFKVLTEKEESNVIELKRDEDRNYIDYKVKKKQELKERLKQKISDVEDLIGFRALDISRSGIAFIINEDESKYFAEDNKYSFYILFDGDIFVVKGADLVYKVNYVGGSQGTKRFKVGLNFTPVEKLTKHITDILSKDNDKGTTKEEFEDLVEE